MSDDNLEWYYVNTDQASVGPVSKAEVKTAFTSGVTTEDCLCWNENLVDWTLIKDVPGLMDYLKPKATPPPAVPSKPSAAQPAAAGGAGFGGGLADILAARSAMQARTQAQSSAATTPTSQPQAVPEAQAEPEAAKPAVAAKPMFEKKLEVSSPQPQSRFGSNNAAASVVSPLATPSTTVTPGGNLALVKSPVVERNTLAVPAPPSNNTNDKANWVELKTPEGLFYYYNKVTKQTTWDKPDCLKSADEMDKAGNWVWMPHAEWGYIPAKLISSDTQYSFLETEDGHRHNISKKIQLDPLNWLSMRRPVQDLVMLDDMNKPLILHALKSRFQKNDIYTNVGNILISINPYKRLPLYSPSIIDQYRRRGNKTMPPHVYLIADEAYTSLLNTDVPQSIVISGESGAGKTECTKQALQYLAEIAGSASNGVEQKILASNPILEAFGNAKTVRNNNSSRFGKYVEINFDNNLQITGSTNTNYLLEKIRVVKQSKGERNFHVFYQMVRGLAPELKKAFHLTQVSDYFYLSQSECDTVEDMDDAEEHNIVINAMKELGWSDSEIENVYRLTAGVLHLGNVQFKSTGDRDCEVIDVTALENCTSLLKVDKDAFHKAVTTRVMRVAGQSDIDVKLSKDEAEAARDALAKFIYEKMFDWIVQRINISIGKGNVRTTAKGASTIGILDIFGFEIFEHNQFEQLLINHTNQMLQLFFNDNTFKREEEVYTSEGIDFQHVEYIPCEPCIELVEKKPHGIIPLIDEEIRMPRGSDQTFMHKLAQNQQKHPNFKTYLKNKDMFVVEHYAGAVLYDSNGFLEKNRDQLTEDAQSVVLASKCPLLVKLFSDGLNSGGNKRATLGSKFSKQLSELNAALNSTEPHYIRCIKPNPKKAALEFHPSMVLEQLTYSGVFEAVKIRKSGYPFRYTHADFYQRFRCVLPQEIRYNYSKQQNNIIDGCKFLLKEFGIENEVQIGKTRVLYRAQQHLHMELKRNIAVEALVIKMQAAYRGWYCRKLKKRLLPLKALCITALASKDLDLIESTLDKCKGCGYDFFEFTKLQTHRFNIIEEKRIEKELLAIINCGNVESRYEELCQILACSNEIGVDNPIIIQCRQVVREIEEKKKATEWLQVGVETVSEEKLEWALERAAHYKMVSPLIAPAQQCYDKIQNEKPIMENLRQQMSVGGFLNEGDVIIIGDLEAAVTAAQQFGMITEQGKSVLVDAQVILEVRQTLSLAQGTKDKALWKNVGNACGKASSELAAHAEVQKACDEVAHQAEVDEITEKLEVDVANRELEPILFGLDQCRRLRVDRAQYPIVEQGEYIANRIETCNGLIQRALASVNLEELVFCVKDAEEFQYEKPHVAKARELRNLVLQLQSDAEYALDILETDPLKDIIARADAINYTSSEIEQCKQWILHTSEEKFLQAKLKCAVKLNDEARRIRLTIEVKELVFKQRGDMFELDNFIRLRKPQDWADRKLLCLNREKLAASCRVFNNDSIHTSLTEHEEDSMRSEMSRKMFKNVLGIMGDRNYGNPITLTQELLKNCLSDPWLRDEVFCQVIKQLTNNPKETSVAKGWSLMACLLEVFPPRPEFENYLGWWLKKNAPIHLAPKLNTLYHIAIFTPALLEVPNEMQLQSIMGGTTLRKVNYEEVRPYTPPVVELPALGQAVAHYEKRLQQLKLKEATRAQEEKENERRKYELGGSGQSSYVPSQGASGVPPVAAPPSAAAVPPKEPEPVEEIDYTNIAPPPIPAQDEQPAAETELPADWYIAYDPNGDPYYYNAVSGECQWDRPV